ncbi:MAG: hypothetical protein ABSH17_12355 [Syntrophobacteraceae bacterium]|jgi:hypothetical protein
MAKLGSEKRPIIVRVYTEELARHVAETCATHGWHYIIGFETDKPEDIAALGPTPFIKIQPPLDSAFFPVPMARMKPESELPNKPFLF